MARFTLTLHKGHQSMREHVSGDDMAQRLHELIIDDQWTLDNIEREDGIVRFGSEGQPVHYEDVDDASEHFLRMQEGWC